MHLIEGKSEATLSQMTAYIRKVNPSVPSSVINMIKYYISEGETEGIRGDYAFAQSCLETGNFTFSGSAVTLSQNNFCGLGVTSNGMRGNSFSSPQLGIRAQIQHLKAYGSTKPLVNTAVDPRFSYVKRGCAKYIEYLGIQENPNHVGWAAGSNYGSKILTIYNNILSMPNTDKKVEWKATGTATCTANAVKIRSTPNGTVIGTLNKDNRFEVDGIVTNGWVHIKVANVGECYIKSDYVKYDNGSIDSSNTSSSNEPTKSLASLTTSISIKLPILKSGYTGSAVNMLQAFLGVKVTGSMNKETITSLNTFKKNVNLSQNGIVDKDTWNSIIAHIKANTFIK